MQIARCQLAPRAIDYNCLLCLALHLLQWELLATWAALVVPCSVCTHYFRLFTSRSPKTRYFHVMIKGEMFNVLSRQTGCASVCVPPQPFWLSSWSVNGLTLLPQPPFFHFLPSFFSYSVTSRDIRLSFYAHSSGIITQGRELARLFKKNNL